MPTFHFYARNHAFCISDIRMEYGSVEEANRAALETATAILSDEIFAGAPNAAVVIRIADDDNTTVVRSAVSLSVAPLLLTR